jgi:outer membrane protein, heavy metal efflux system
MSETGRTAQYDARFEERTLPELPDAPTWRDVLRRSLLANGDLEAAYFEWRAAVDRIDVASAWPNTRLMLGYSYMFSGDELKAFDRSTFAVSPDAMENLALPLKTSRQGRVAFDEARASGARFRAAKFDLQQRVLSGWAGYTLAGERLRIERERQTLARQVYDTAKARVRAGGAQQDLLRAEVVLRTAENAVKTARAEQTAAGATLNGMLARAPDAPLAVPRSPEVRPIPVDDAALLALAVEQNPQLEALARQAEGRADALELARLQWLPDINPTFMFTGAVSQAIGAAVALPTTIPQIRASIRDAEATLRGSEAVLRQARSDRSASFVATLLTLRNAERQAGLFETSIVPASERALTISRQAYSAGSATYLDMIDAQNLLLDARLTLAESRAMREARLAELEALMGTDIETLASPSESPTTPAPAANPAAAAR